MYVYLWTQIFQLLILRKILPVWDIQKCSWIENALISYTRDGGNSSHSLIHTNHFCRSVVRAHGIWKEKFVCIFHVVERRSSTRFKNFYESVTYCKSLLVTMWLATHYHRDIVVFFLSFRSITSHKKFLHESSLKCIACSNDRTTKSDQCMWVIAIFSIPNYWLCSFQ